MNKIFIPQLTIKASTNSFTFSGLASVFNVPDSYNDIVLPGAFQNSNLNCKEIKLLWQHNTEMPIGAFTKIEETVTGLFVEGKILTNLAQGKEAATLLESGAIDGLSIGFEAIDTFP